MMPNEISVRQWQEMFRAGMFHQDSLHIPEQAGWDDFYDPVNNKGLQNLSKLVMSITHPFILDNYHVCFLHHTPGVGPMYGAVYFDPLSGEWNKKSFHIVLDSPHERKKWVLETRRYGDGGPEYECGDIRSMARYINSMASELEQDIQPEFIAEKQAVRLYAAFSGEPVSICIYREGDHRYSYTSFQDGRQRTVLAAASLEDVPPGFVLEQAETIKGIHVCCPENAGISPPKKTAGKSRKRKEAER